MNEDIKALRELLKAGKKGRSAPFNPSQLERVLDDAERYHWMRDKAPGEINFDYTRNRNSGGNFFTIHVPFDGRPLNNDEDSSKAMDEAIDQARKA